VAEIRKHMAAKTELAHDLLSRIEPLRSDGRAGSQVTQVGYDLVM
jgi:hypothetical protein